MTPILLLLSRLTQEEALPPALLMESRRIAACILNFCGRHPDVVAPLFDLLSIFTVRADCHWHSRTPAAWQSKLGVSLPLRSLQDDLICWLWEVAWRKASQT